MGIRELARALGVSPPLVSRLVRRGMPTELEEAKAWRQQYIKARKEAGPPVIVPIAINDVQGSEDQDLEASLRRLRAQERTIAASLQALMKEGRLAEAASLRREHLSTVKALFDAESRALKIGEASGRLISLERALSMISQALAEPLIMLRRLPELGRDAEQKRALEAFLAGILSAIQTGAAEGLKTRKAGYG